MIFYFIAFLVLLAVVFYAKKTLSPKNIPNAKYTRLLRDANMEESLQKMLSEIKKGQAQLFDVREKSEWDAGHLKIAKLMPLSGLKRDKVSLGSYDKNKTTYIHCRSGNRCLMAAPLLEEKGFKKIVCLELGYELLKDEGLASVE